MKPFPTTAPTKYKWDGGYAGGTIRPSDLACQLFKENIPGAELACYMLRRFGWPNEGSDPHKHFMSWTLTTSIPGLYLCVTPYLAETAGPLETFGKGDYIHTMGNLHFAVRFTEEVGRKMDYDAGRERYFARLKANLLKWWAAEGSKKYSIGFAKAGDPEEKLVLEIAEPANGKVFGLFESKPEHKADGVSNDLEAWNKKAGGFVMWAINDWREDVLKHKLPKMAKREKGKRKNRFARQCETALKRTMLDLLRTTNVRDVDINIFGQVKDSKETPPTRPVVRGHVEPFIGAGNTPEYWYSKAGRADYARELKTRKKP